MPASYTPAPGIATCALVPVATSLEHFEIYGLPGAPPGVVAAHRARKRGAELALQQVHEVALVPLEVAHPGLRRGEPDAWPLCTSVD